jgi:hypothetical protein
MIRIRDSHSEINGNEQVTEVQSSTVDILGDNDKVLFSIELKGKTLSISGGDNCKHQGELLASTFSIKPVASNVIKVEKDINEI